MKRFFTSLALLIVAITVNAQSAAQEAKAAYLLAEEEFGAGKYTSALFYLEEAATKLGNANAKILYLKVMALQVLSQDDEENIPKLKKAIEAFEKAPDFASFNEEKQLEVMKLKLKLAKAGTLGKTLNPLEASVYSRVGITGWQAGVKLEDMKDAHQEYFAKAKKTVLSDTLTLYQLESDQFFTVFVNKGIVQSVTKYILASTKDDASYSIGAATLNELKNYLGGTPEDTVTKNASAPSKLPSYSMTTRTLTWKNKDIQVNLVLTTTEYKMHKEPSDYNSSVIVSVGYVPKQSF